MDAAAIEAEQQRLIWAYLGRPAPMVVVAAPSAVAHVNPAIHSDPFNEPGVYTPLFTCWCTRCSVPFLAKSSGRAKCRPCIRAIARETNWHTVKGSPGVRTGNRVGVRELGRWRPDPTEHPARVVAHETDTRRASLEASA